VALTTGETFGACCAVVIVTNPRIMKLIKSFFTLPPWLLQQEREPGITDKHFRFLVPYACEHAIELARA
jgi:hypothetical protein